MGNRMLKDSIRTSKTVNAMSDFQFRVWIHLITYVDDYGRGSADPELIKGFVFPRRKRISESDIRKTLAELAGMGCISLYEVDGESYFYFPNWGKHQRIQSKKSKFPPPEDGAPQNPTECHGESPRPTECHGESPPEPETELETETKENPPQSPPGGGRVRVRFSPPEAEEVRAYCRERGSCVDPEEFVAFYASKGWLVGKTPMKDWKAAVRAWEIRKKQAGQERKERNADGKTDAAQGDSGTQWNLQGLVL